MLVQETAADDCELEFWSESRDVDEEVDALHILPFHLIPFETPGLRHVRMIKNMHFNSMVEVFRDGETGSGQVEPTKLGALFGWAKGERHPDSVLIAKLSLLQSFDVYTLRMNLRGLGIDVENNDGLRLSDSKRRDLDHYMQGFTRPLIRIINSEDDDIGINNINDLVRAFGARNNASALRNLKKLSRKLKIILTQLPEFLTDYGDVFLSLAYFKDRFDEISIKSEFFLRKLDEVKNKDSSLSDPRVDAMILSVEADLEGIMSAVRDRLAGFDRHTESLWENLTSEKFREVKLLIESNHATLGGMLCGLQIKLDGFHELFQDKNAPHDKIVDCVISTMKPGLDRIKHIDNNAHYSNSPMTGTAG